jgi:diaminohydroxyphosphoribosylaminopyrimidine deaminase / 5-amino-6-(5-phosphoribosylamino)uracil reductase
VAGKGIARLEEAGVQVQVGILEKEAKEVNKRFILQITTGLPYVILKWATSQDGFIAPLNTGNFQVSGAESKIFSHQFRAREDAILVGYNTAMLDNPNLNVRLVEGQSPTRIIIDKYGKLPLHLNIFNGTEKTILISPERTFDQSSLSIPVVFISPEKYEVREILSELATQGIQSLLVEGGSKTLQSFINAGLWNEAYAITNPNLLLYLGYPVPKFNHKVKDSFLLGQDEVAHFVNQLI